MDEQAQAMEAAIAGQQERIASLIAQAWELGAQDPRRALALSLEAHALLQQVGAEGRRDQLVSTLLNLARFHYELSELDRAQVHLEEALTLAQEGEQVRSAPHAAAPRKTLGRIYMGMGLVRWRLGDYAAALARLLEALNMVREAGHKQAEANILSNIGMVYGVTGEHESAKEVYEQALEIYAQSEDKIGHGLAFNNMAMVCVQAEEFAEALDYARCSLDLARETEHPGVQTNALDTTGAAYMGLGRLDEALTHFEQSATLAAELGDRHDELAAWIHIGQVHARKERGDGSSQAWLAHDALQRALAMALELGDKEQIRHCHHELARLFKIQGDFEQALRHHEQYHDADKAIYRERADMRFKTLQVIHETETARQEAEIAQLRNISLEKEIEERRRVEAALRESETRFRLLMEESPIGVHIYAPDGTLLHTNRAWREMWDFGEQFRTGKFNILHSSVLGQLGMRELVECAFSGESVQLPEVEVDAQSLGLPALVRGGAGSRILRAQAYSLMDQESELKNVVLLIEDITEQRRSEQALSLIQEMDKRRAALGVLAGGVAHDFNNLLVAMLGQASLALNQLGQGEPARAHVQKVVNAAQQASDLTQQMLAYSGRGHFAIRSLDLNALIRDHVDLWQAATGHRVQLQLELTPSLPAIEGDAGQLQQMILNLIMNGAEARPSGSMIVRTNLIKRSDLFQESEVARRYSHYTGRPLEPGAYVKLEIVDEATGISADDLPHIFDPFFTTKEQGRGLGLAAVLGIVRGHKAGLAVRNNRQGGTTFEILFPAGGPGMNTQQVGAHAQAGFPNSNGNSKEGVVLVIDDETHVREAVTDILGLEDISVLAAEDGYQGLEMYRQHRADVELILLDLSMPGMDGEETYRRLRQIDPEVCVVLSSGYSASDIAGHFEAQGAKGFLQKPYSVTTLVDEVRRHLRN